MEENDGCLSKKRKQMCILCGPTDNVRSRFPKWDKMRDEWIRFCERVSSNRKFLNADTARLCHIHFNEDCIRRSGAGKILGVIPKAIPTVYTSGQIHRLKDLTKDSETNAVTDVSITIRDAFKRVMTRSTQNERCSTETRQWNTGFLNKGLQTTVVISGHPIIEFRTANESETRNEANETNSSEPISVVHHEKSEEDTRISVEQSAVYDLQAEENSCDADSMKNSSTPRSSRRTSSTPTNSCPKDCVGAPTTPTSSHPCSSKGRRHSVRHIGDIRVTDLESPRSRRNCVSVMHHESRIMKNKIQALQKQNLRLKNKVRNLEELLEKVRKDNLVSKDRMYVNNEASRHIHVPVQYCCSKWCSETYDSATAFEDAQCYKSMNSNNCVIT